jgi:hypothetical protein
MKKAIIVLVISLAIISCGGPVENKPVENKPVEATHDSISIDSSLVLPVITDTANNQVYEGSGPRTEFNIK